MVGRANKTERGGRGQEAPLVTCVLHDYSHNSYRTESTFETVVQHGARVKQTPVYETLQRCGGVTEGTAQPSCPTAVPVYRQTCMGCHILC